MKPRILIADSMHESIIPMLESIGLQPDYQPKITRDEMLLCLKDYEGLIIRSKTEVDKEFLGCCQSLRFIARAGAGIDNIDVSYLEKKNILLFNAPEGNRDALGEHTLGLLLSLLHHIGISDREVRNKIWLREKNRGHELKGKTVGIFGYGYMGSAFAEKLVGLGPKIIGYDKYKQGYGNTIIKETTLDEFKEQTEILSIHVPLTDETRQLFDSKFFRQFQKLKVLLNTSRGEVIHQSNLIELLNEGFIERAGLDVLEIEKLDRLEGQKKEEFETLINMDQVLFTPHIGGWTYESYQRINEVIVEKIKKSELFEDY